MDVSFVALSRDDFGLLATWLAEPLVARWWNHETSTDALEKDFGPSVDRLDSTDIFVVAIDDRPFGLIQRYPIASYHDYRVELEAVCPVPDGAVSIDYLIGESSRRGIGLGVRMIAEFVQASRASASCVLVPVSAANQASWRALERAGFTRIAEGELEPDNPIDSRDHFIYCYEFGSVLPG